jgi:hypothetical protein
MVFGRDRHLLGRTAAVDLLAATRAADVLSYARNREAEKEEKIQALKKYENQFRSRIEI